MKPFSIVMKIWYWSYERGSWQYDVMCVAILAFIFLVPARVFDDPEARPRREGTLTETFVPLPSAGDGSIQSLSAAVGGNEVHRIEIVRTPDGTIRGYKVWNWNKPAGQGQ